MSMSTNATTFFTGAPAIAEKRYYPESTFVFWWEKVFLAILVVILGMIGNLLSFILLSRQRFRDSAAGFYMRALSLSDAGVMLGLVGNHTMRVYQVQMHSAIYCKIVYFLIKWFIAVSDWILGTMCLERCISVLFPLQSERFRKPRNNRIALGIILTLLGVYYAYAFEAYGSIQGICRTVSMSYPVSIRTMVDYSLVLVPMFLIISSNVVIVVSMVRSARVTRSPETSPFNSTQRSLIVMLVVISVAFVVLKSPYFVVKFILHESVTRKLGYTFYSRTAARHRLLIGLCTSFGYVNHAVNSYLYILCGEEYRKELKLMITSSCKKKPVSEVEMANTVYTTVSNIDEV
ncbi:hypothetical protein CAPTEDRAFT_216681 [Capitella teleta]|uniref:G-protein coupled receptors family 1 profile domain-containing protein n=1 Tax=Capitella teleta TaxID=283909 RepID=R7V9L6_CAPTE|nr:hypothetical protein CAPTEDRAFT_216681 [Capitella teleta]|eukprot:ELU15269.1 hypothetical protein CAPTEDRAFT_216681 [Capitella teleta]